MPMPNKVLIVEDSDDIRENMAELLRMEGYEVEEARNGLEAYVLLKRAEEKPGLILLDLMMPVMSGPELMCALAEHPNLSHLPIVIVSAMLDSCDPIDGAIKALRKPVSVDALLQVVQEYCTSPKNGGAAHAH